MSYDGCDWLDGDGGDISAVCGGVGRGGYFSIIRQPLSIGVDAQRQSS